jgi:hypothetical protein
VAIGQDSFIVADDEENILKVYRTINDSKPMLCYDVSQFLELLPDYPEVDIEGATKVGNRVYWIGSHGRNREGKLRPNRYRFFATEIASCGERTNGEQSRTSRTADGNSIRPAGKSYKDLVFDLIGTKNEVQKDLNKAAGFAFELKGKDLSRLAPKNEGLNIEGLCASPDGKTLYIGFRNPLHKKGSKEYAIVMPLNNAASVIERGQKLAFGRPLLWDLNGLGIRDMVYSPYHKAFFLVAGPARGGEQGRTAGERPDWVPALRGPFALYRWSGQEDQQPQLVRKIAADGNKFTPEALITFENSDKLLILSDDGTIEVNVASPSECKEPLIDDGKCLNKYLTNPDKKSFRAAWIKP